MLSRSFSLYIFFHPVVSVNMFFKNQAIIFFGFFESIHRNKLILKDSAVMWKLQVLALPLQIHSLKYLLSKTFLRTHVWDNGHCSEISFLHQTHFFHSFSLDHKLFLLVFVKAPTTFLSWSDANLIMSSLLNLRNPGSVWATWLCKRLKKITHSYIMHQFIRSSYLYFVISWLILFI